MKDIPKNIQLFYDSIENIKSLNIWNINKEIVSIEEIDEINEEWKSKILIDRKVLAFNLNEGDLQLNFQTTNIEGKRQINRVFDKTHIDYIANRLNSSNNSWVKSRYSHILWQTTKNNFYAEIAINNYLENLKKIGPEEVQELSKIFSALFFISKKSKQKISEVKEVTLIFLDGNFVSWLKFDIINSILKNNLFSNPELLSYAEKCLDWIDFTNQIFYFTNKRNLEISISLFNKISKKPDKIYELLANNEDFILEQHQDDTDFIKYTTTGTKASYLKLAKKNDEYEATMREFNRLKKTITLKKISVELEDEHTEMFNEYLNQKSKAILKLSPEKILAFFSTNDSIMVDPKEIENDTKESFNNSISSLYNTSIFDINSNFKKLKKSDAIDFEIIKSYSIAYGIKIHSLFLKVFVNGIISGKINYYNVYNFLEIHTWYGKKFKRGMASAEIDEKTSWITLLAPGIHNLFAQFELLVIMNTNKISNFILSIDSLTLKFEGALRDFIRLSGGNTTIEKKGELQEQLLEELLDNPIIIQYFTDKDIALFKHTFTRKGKNIRNNVAHSFMEFSDYNFQIATLVFFCLLRLGKYTFEKQKTK